MADLRGSSGVCSENCGCSSPCPGGLSCRCYTTTGVPSANDPSVEHQKCSCGEHCGCNPCTCTKRMTTADCKCAEGCTCDTCT